MDKQSAKQKSASMPGYARGFHDVFRSQQTSALEASPAPKTVKAEPVSPADSVKSMAVTKSGEKKKKWGGWGALFRRNKTAAKKASSDDSSDTDASASVTKRGFLSRKKNKREDKKPEEPASYVGPILPRQQDAIKPPLSQTALVENRVNFNVPRPMFAAAAGRSSQPPTPPVRPSHTLGVAGSELNASQTSLSRRVKRDMRARAAARKPGSQVDSSSSDEDSRGSCRYNSQDSLNSRSTLSRRTRSARTERYNRRKSRDEDSLRREKTSQLSINSQHSLESTSGSSVAKSNRSDYPSVLSVQKIQNDFPVSPPPRKPELPSKWAATVVYQESEVESSVRLPSSFTSKSSATLSPARTPLSLPPQSSREASVDRKGLPPPPPPRNPSRNSILLSDIASRPTSYSFGEFRHDYQNVDKDGHIVADRSPSTASVPTSLHFFPKPFRSAVNSIVNPTNTRSTSSIPNQTPPSHLLTSQKLCIDPPSVIQKTTPLLPSPLQSYTQHYTEMSPGGTNLNQKIPGTPAEPSSPSSPVEPAGGFVGRPVRKTASDFWRAKELEQQKLRTNKLGVNRSESSPVTSISPYKSPESSFIRQKPNLLDIKPSHNVAGSGSCSVSSQSPVADSKPVLKPVNPPPTPKRNASHNNLQLLQQQQQHHIRDLSKLQPTKDKNLEQAISELEAVYQSLNFNDEDLLDRAGKPNLPVPQQEFRRGLSVDSPGSGSTEGSGGFPSGLDYKLGWNSPGAADTVQINEPLPPSRRSDIPDKVTDDMALRRMLRRTHSEPDPESVLAKSGSYFLISPAHNEISGKNHSFSDALNDRKTPVSRVTSSVRITEQQQAPVPPTKAADLDYLLMNKTNKQRSPFTPIHQPFDSSNLNGRKEVGLIPVPVPARHVNTEKLDDILQEAQIRQDPTLSLRKKRAVRSLSANIAQLIRKDSLKTNAESAETGQALSFEDDDMDARAQSMSDLFGNAKIKEAEAKTIKTPRAVKQRSEMRKIGRAGTFEEHGNEGGLAVTSTQPVVYPCPSWVERAELSDFATSTETLTEFAKPASLDTKPDIMDSVSSAIQVLANSGKDAPAAKEVVKTLDHLIADLTSIHKTNYDANVTALKPPSGMREEAITHMWEESPLFRVARPPTPHSSDSSEASCGAQEVQRILQHSCRSTPGRKKSATPEQSLPLNSLSTMNSGAPTKQTNCNEVASASNTQQESPAGASKPLRKMSSDETRAERIARYKEERKKQLQARFGAAVVGGKKDDSSSSEDHQEEHSYTKYRLRKQQQKENIANSSVKPSSRNESDANEKNSNADKAASPGTAIKRFIRRESPLSEEPASPGLVRTNRAARLRAAAAATTTPQSDAKQETQSRTKRPSLSGRKGNASPTDLVNPAAGAGSSEGINPEGAGSATVSQEVVLRRKLSSQNDKDKSTKRKSNLNRAVTEEQVTSTGDTIEDPAKRGRRRPRGADVTASYSSADTDPSSSADSLIHRRDVREGEKQTNASEMPVGKYAPATNTDSTDKPTQLRPTLRESIPAFLNRRTPSRNELSPGSDSNAKLSPSTEKKPFQPSKVNTENKPTAGYPSVPWRSTGRAAITPSVKAEDITARIEALTAMAKQTVARVDRLTSNGKSVTVPDDKLQKTPLKDADGQASKVDSVKAVVPANDQSAKTHSILKNKAAVETGPELRPKSPDALKSAVRIRTESGCRAESPEPMSILKRKISKEELSCDKLSGEPQSILKRRPSRDESTVSRSLSPEPHSILKRKTKVEATVPEADNVEPRPILKKRSSTEDGAEPRPILKKKSSTDDEHEGDKPKPILKSPRRRSPELTVSSDSESLRILRRRTVTAEEQSTSVAERINHAERTDRTTMRTAEAAILSAEVPWRQPAKAAGTYPDSASEDTKTDSTDNHGASPTTASTGAIPKQRKSADSNRSEDPSAEVAAAPASQVQINEAVNSHVHFSQDTQDLQGNERVQLVQEHIGAEAKSTGSPPGRSSRSRCITQPVTLEEVHEAAKIALPGVTEQESAEQKDAEPDSGSPMDDPSKLSLADRVRLFNKKMTEIASEPAAAERVRPTRKKRPLTSRFQTQPITSLEVHRALVNPFSSATTESTPLGTRIKELSAVDIQQEGSDTESRGLDRIRGILRKKSTESVAEIKGILRSKSPAQKEETVNGAPKPILKRQSDFFQSGGSSSSSAEDLSVPPDQNLATKLLSVEAEAKAQQHESEAKRSVEMNREDGSSSSLSFATPPPPPEAPGEPVSKDCGQAVDSLSLADTPALRIEESSAASSSEQSVAVVSESTSTQKVTIIHQSSGERSEEDNSGTETSTTVILRLASTCVTKSQSETQMWKKKETVSSTLVEQKSSIASSKSSESEEDCPSSSSAEVRTTVSLRLAALQKSGDSEWRKRLSKIKADDPEEEVKQAAVLSDDRASSIADRLNLLSTAQKGWKKRVEETDAIKFTVAGKMGRGSSVEEVPSGSAPSSPMLDRKKKTPKPVKYRSKALDEANDSKSSPVTPSEEGHAPFLRSTSEPNGKADGRSEARPVSRVVAVPRPDDETFTSFFASTTTISSNETTTVTGIIEGDLDAIIAPTEDLIIQRKSVKIQKRKFTSRNPIKSLTARTDLQDEYEEVDTGVAERELRRIKLEQLAKNSNLAVEALAGLASKEDFTAVTLKTAQNPTTSAVHLIHIKGRRHVQSRLVEAVVSSVNSGDAYVLVTPNEVFQWMGQYSNVIERAKCADVAQQILAKKNLGCAQATQVTIIDEDKVGSGAYGASKRFWKALGAEEGKQKRAAGPPEEDEIYEAAVIETNMVWSLEDEELLPVDGYWGSLPKTDMLLPQKVYVFDFGSEMYVWSGKQAPFEARKKAMHLAKELWDEGYDYSECEVSPLDPAGLVTGSKCSKQRPSWSLFSKANQHMEPVLFREKFLDWPDTSRLIKVKSQDAEEKGRTNVDSNTLVAFDARLMLDNALSDPSLELEGAQVGRGVEYYDAAEKRLSEIVTLSVKTWHILEYDKLLLPETSFGQFHSCDTYIVRWQYRITVTGRDLKGQASKHGVLGRDRCCYFFWHGRDAPPTEQGASALNTIDLDSERGPHVRVVQGRESPAFLALFKGRMIVHKGKRQEDPASINTPWRMYMVRGERENEACLVEISKGGQALRSRGSYLVVNRSTGIIYVWHGGKSQKHTRQVASSVANQIKAHKPAELEIKSAKVSVKELYEGAETKDFWEGLGEDSRNSHFSLLNSKQRFDHTVRLFHLTSWTGQFKAEEVACLIRLPQVTSSYPFLQSDIYEANQPALFLIDNQHEVWLWQGWWPVNLDDNDNTRTGSGKLRWTAERKCAYETTLHYCQLKNPQNPPEAFLVSAGLEPLEFKCLFPEWVDDEDIAELNIQEGRNPGEKLLVREVLDRLTRTTYTLEELQAKPPPEGVDPTKLESYLTDTAFQEIMKMTKDEFYALPSWKQTALRKEVGLF